MQEHRKTITLADRERAVGAIHLEIRGFARQSQLPVTDIARWIEALPGFHLAGLTAVIYDPDRQLDPQMDVFPRSSPPTHKGQYVKAERQVLVHQFTNPEELRHILYHEIGHYVFDHVLTTALRRRWVLELSLRKSARITRYARRNALEDFAESYAVFVTDPTRVEVLHQKYVFLRDQVFGGIARNFEHGYLDISV